MLQWLYFSLLERWAFSLWWSFYLELIKQSSTGSISHSHYCSVLYVNPRCLLCSLNFRKQTQTHKMLSDSLPLCHLEPRCFNHLTLSVCISCHVVQWMRPAAITNREKKKKPIKLLAFALGCLFYGQEQMTGSVPRLFFNSWRTLTKALVDKENIRNWSRLTSIWHCFM